MAKLILVKGCTALAGVSFPHVRSVNNRDNSMIKRAFLFALPDDSECYGKVIPVCYRQ
ncbi:MULTISPECIES: hypothetical protein [Erwiniaceae]|uniref:hypothetical protein n=1 Tax=Erwiniaceae TaxID=1903409 RepID=UPI0012E051C9|nr:MULTISPECIES: hypothetical protein [Erwiniaceae]MBK0089751.1 hypothetical protein [Erwinia sp. S59]MBK0126461.1 hypothetical protein [Pantoea sp. S61]